MTSPSDLPLLTPTVAYRELLFRRGHDYLGKSAKGLWDMRTFNWRSGGGGGGGGKTSDVGEFIKR